MALGIQVTGDSLSGRVLPVPRWDGWGPDDLAEHGIGFGLFEMPRLASKVTEIVTEDRARAKAATVSAVAGAVA